MKRYYLILFVLVVFVALPGLLLQNQAVSGHGTIQVVEKDAKMLIEKISNLRQRLEQMAFNVMVTDQIVLNAFRTICQGQVSSFAANTTCRQEIFQNQIDTEIEFCGYDGWRTRYTAWSDGWDYQKDSIPIEIDQNMDAIRAIILDKAREHLKDPDNLKAFYNAKKAIVLTDFRIKPPEQRQAFIEWLRNAAEGLQVFNQSELSPDLYSYEWVERRRAEGGDKLVEAWAWILKDLLAGLSPND